MSNQPVSQSAGQPVSESAGQPVSESAGQADPPVVIPAELVEVISAERETVPNAPPEIVKKAEIATVEVGPKAVLPQRNAQLYYPLKSPAVLRGVEVTTGVRIVRVLIGADTYPLEKGQHWGDVYPDGIRVDVPEGGVFLTTVVTNDGETEIRASLAYLLEMLTKDAAAEGPTGEQRAAQRTVRQLPGGRRIQEAPDLRRGERVAAVSRPRVRVGPGTDEIDDGKPRRNRSAGPAPRRVPNAPLPGVNSPMETIRSRAARAERLAAEAASVDQPVSLSAGQPDENAEPPTGFVTIRVETYRWQVLRDLAKKNLHVSSKHIGSLRNAIVRKGQSPGEPLTLPIALADRLEQVLSRGGRLTIEERELLAECLDSPSAINPSAGQPERIDGQADRLTGGQADKLTGGQADRLTGGQADGLTEVSP